MKRLREWWRKITTPPPPCARCGGHWSDIEHQSWDPGWPSMPVGKEPVDHWYEAPKE